MIYKICKSEEKQMILDNSVVKEQVWIYLVTQDNRKQNHLY